MTIACNATCYHLATDYIAFSNYFYTTLDLTIISNILEARISLPRLSDVKDTPQRNNAPTVQARIRRLKTPYPYLAPQYLALSRDFASFATVSQRQRKTTSSSPPKRPCARSTASVSTRLIFFTESWNKHPYQRCGKKWRALLEASQCRQDAAAPLQSWKFAAPVRFSGYG